MSRRRLDLSVDLLVNFLKPFQSDGLYVMKKGGESLPANARIVSVRYSPYREDTVEVTLESSSWPKEGDCTSVMATVNFHEVEKAVLKDGTVLTHEENDGA